MVASECSFLLYPLRAGARASIEQISHQSYYHIAQKLPNADPPATLRPSIYPSPATHRLPSRIPHLPSPPTHPYPTRLSLQHHPTPPSSLHPPPSPSLPQPARPPVPFPVSRIQPSRSQGPPRPATPPSLSLSRPSGGEAGRMDGLGRGWRRGGVVGSCVGDGGAEGLGAGEVGWGAVWGNGDEGARAP